MNAAFRHALQGKVLQQLKDKADAVKYLDRGETMELVGVEFSKDSRSVVRVEL